MYIPVRQLIGTWITHYRAKKREKKNLKSPCSSPRYSSPVGEETSAGDFFSPPGEKKRLSTQGEETSLRVGRRNEA
ncbi:hypothetical protein BHM03_00052384, partial [Ensete ventricosum]